MVDFSKLMDPVYRAEAAKRREEESIAAEALAQKVHSALRALQHEVDREMFSEKEWLFIRSCYSRTLRHYPLTPSQLSWLFDLAQRHSPAWRLAQQAVIVDS